MPPSPSLLPIPSSFFFSHFALFLGAAMSSTSTLALWSSTPSGSSALTSFGVAAASVVAPLPETVRSPESRASALRTPSSQTSVITLPDSFVSAGAPPRLAVQAPATDNQAGALNHGDLKQHRRRRRSLPPVPVENQTLESSSSQIRPSSSSSPPAASMPTPLTAATPMAGLLCFSEYRKRSVCEDSFDYVGSSSSWTHSSSKRDLKQDDHFLGYHYYHRHARCLVSIACLATHHLYIKLPKLP